MEYSGRSGYLSGFHHSIKGLLEKSFPTLSKFGRWNATKGHVSSGNSGITPTLKVKKGGSFLW